MKKILSLLIATAFIAMSSCTGDSSSPASFTTIEKGFKNPDSMQLAVYWYWLSDNISKEGVIKDLEAMKKVGINRAFIGNIGLDDVPYGKVKLFTPEWWEITHTALKKATELGIEIGMFNSPGWSQSGGPWIKPEQSMRYLASSQISVKGSKGIGETKIKLPEVAKDAMEDVKIIAYPIPEGSLKTKSKSWTITKKNIERLSFDMSLGEKLPVRSFIFKVDDPTRVNVNAELFVKEGTTYRSLKKIHIDRSNPALNVGFDPYAPVVISIPETMASDFRFEVSSERAQFQANITDRKSTRLNSSH